MQVLIFSLGFLGLGLVQGLGLNPVLSNTLPGVFQAQSPVPLLEARKPVDSFIEQKLDHFDSLNLRTWQQFYSQTSWNSSAVIAGRRQYHYQMCRDFGDFETTASTSQPFGNFGSSNEFVQECKDYIDQSFSPQWIKQYIVITNAEFGGDNPKVTNVVFVQGSLDPWRQLGVNAALSASATAIVIENSSHISDMATAHATDSVALKEARLEIKEAVGRWIRA